MGYPGVSRDIFRTENPRAHKIPIPLAMVDDGLARKVIASDFLFERIASFEINKKSAPSDAALKER